MCFTVCSVKSSKYEESLVTNSFHYGPVGHFTVGYFGFRCTSLNVTSFVLFHTSLRLLHCKAWSPASFVKWLESTEENLTIKSQRPTENMWMGIILSQSCFWVLLLCLKCGIVSCRFVPLMQPLYPKTQAFVIPHVLLSFAFLCLKRTHCCLCFCFSDSWQVLLRGPSQLAAGYIFH